MRVCQYKLSEGTHHSNYRLNRHWDAPCMQLDFLTYRKRSRVSTFMHAKILLDTVVALDNGIGLRFPGRAYMTTSVVFFTEGSLIKPRASSITDWKVAYSWLYRWSLPLHIAKLRFNNPYRWDPNIRDPTANSQQVLWFRYWSQPGLIRDFMDFVHGAHKHQRLLYLDRQQQINRQHSFPLMIIRTGQMQVL